MARSAARGKRPGRRTGPLARLGHNHVMVNRALRGAVSFPDAAGAAGADGAARAAVFWLDVPAAGFVVDDDRARAEEGPDFAAEVSDDAKSGTRQNMLSAGVLDADEFPVITIRSIAISDSGEATVSIGIAGHESTIDVTFERHSDDQRLSASGSLQLRQSALGLTPYSLMLGALQVQDSVTIKFKIVALPG
jgi:hypothetical protein